MVDVAEIERELRGLWKQMAQPGDNDAQQHAVTRACVLNLLIYAPGEKRVFTGGKEVG